MKIIVRRGDGGHPGPDIIEPLLSSAPAARERGRAEIDAAATDNNQLLTITYRDGIRRGQLIDVHDALQGFSWRGHIDSVEHRWVDGKGKTILGVRRAHE